ncbi:MAG: tetratricopeptide repeat protein [Planctomycetota bacterium]
MGGPLGLIKTPGRLLRRGPAAVGRITPDLLVDQASSFISDCREKGVGEAVKGLGLAGSVLDPTSISTVLMVSLCFGSAAYSSFTRKREADKAQAALAKLGRDHATLIDAVSDIRAMLADVPWCDTERDPDLAKRIRAFEQGDLKALRPDQINDFLRLVDEAPIEEADLAKLQADEDDTKRSFDDYWTQIAQMRGMLEGVGKKLDAIQETQQLHTNLLHEIRSIVRQQASLPDAPLRTGGSVSLLPNRRFVGRVGELGDLQQWLATDGGSAFGQVLALVGPGGLGKSELARHAAIAAAGLFDGVWWLSGRRETAAELADPLIREQDRLFSNATFVASLRRLAVDMGMDADTQAPPQQQFDLVRKTLAQGRHLLILDDVPPLKQVEEIFPTGAGSRVLFTQRGGNFRPSLGMSLTVTPLPSQSALRLLTADRADLQAPSEDVTADLLGIAADLGYHTLALTQAGRYLGLLGAACPPAQLRADLAAQNIDYLADELSELVPDDAETDLCRGLAKTMGLLLPLIEGKDAELVLRHAAYLAPDPIPLWLLALATELEDMAVHKAAVLLHSHGLAEHDKDTATLTLHILTQRTLRERDEAAGMGLVEPWMNTFLSIFSEEVNTDKPILWPRQRAVAEHARAFSAHATGHAEETLLLNQIAFAANRDGFHDLALAGFSEAERIDRAAYGDEHPNVAIRVNNIGSALKALGRVEEALSKYEEAERIDRAAYGDEHPNVAIDVNNIGGALRALGRVEEGKQRQIEAFDICIRTVGPRAEFTVVTAWNLTTHNIDPIARTRALVGDDAAEVLRAALAKKYGSRLK